MSNDSPEIAINVPAEGTVTVAVFPLVEHETLPFPVHVVLVPSKLSTPQ
jgi:hypothetical protein